MVIRFKLVTCKLFHFCLMLGKQCKRVRVYEIGI
jgi:hypothetical protein